MAEFIPPRNDEELTERLCQRLKVERIPARIRNRLESEFRDALFGGKEEYRLLVRILSAELKKMRQQKRKRARELVDRPIDVDSLMDPRETTRERVLAEEFARLALDPSGWQPKVIRFRNGYLGGTPISETAAYGVLNSPAAAHLRWEFLERSDIPVVGHTSRIVSHTESRDPAHPGRTRDRLEFAIDWDGGHHETFTEDSRQTADYLTLEYPKDQNEMATVLVKPESPLGRLKTLATELAGKYLWDEAEATWFVLTGATPSTPAFFAQLEGCWDEEHALLRINLSIQPWVSAKTVMRFYRQQQQRLLGHRNRHPQLKSLVLMDAVAQMRHDGRTWLECLDGWNRSHPRPLRYRRADVRNFRRDYEAIYSLVIKPNFKVMP